MHHLKLVGVLSAFAACLALTLAPPASAWGEEGHRYINRVAAEHMPVDMPAFFRNAAARLSFLGPEPDRWRDNKELFKALGEVNAPDHFIDIDKPQNFEAMPNDRCRTADSKKFVAERLAAGSQMLANLWYTAYLGSASIKPDGQ